jgi:hypothetical protein
MKSIELKIGNILNWQVGKSIMQGVVTSISTESIVIDHKTTFKTRSESDTYRLIPIPLTEEWLLKFGFLKIKHQFNMNDGSLCEHWELNGNDKRWLLYYSTQNFAFNEPKLYYLHLRHNKYVHQLQNLYFALTGTELEIK